eukprot:356058-Chlamydomonas_euryale.AAC.5
MSAPPSTSACSKKHRAAAWQDTAAVSTAAMQEIVHAGVRTLHTGCVGGHARAGVDGCVSRTDTINVGTSSMQELVHAGLCTLDTGRVVEYVVECVGRGGTMCVGSGGTMCVGGGACTCLWQYTHSFDHVQVYEKLVEDWTDGCMDSVDGWMDSVSGWMDGLHLFTRMHLMKQVVLQDRWGTKEGTAIPGTD